MLQTTTCVLLRVSDLLDYSAEDLTGKSMYALVHAADVDKIKQTHVDCEYRFIFKLRVNLIVITSDQEGPSDVQLLPTDES